MPDSPSDSFPAEPAARGRNRPHWSPGRTVWRALLLLGGILAASATSWAQSGRVAVLEGAWPALEPRLVSDLAEPLNWQVSGQGLRTALAELARARQVRVWLDRRVDPDQPLELVSQGEPLATVFERLAAERGLGVGHLGGVVYLGPAASAAELRTLGALSARAAAALPAPLARRLATRAPWHWDDLAEPRSLAAELADQAGLTIVNPDRLPHDLWPAGSWPPLALVDRLTLLGIGFDLSYEITSEGELRWQDRAPRPQWLAEYPAGADPETRLRAWSTLAPEATIERRGERLRVAALIEVHERLLAAEAPARRRPAGVTPPRPTAPTERYSLRVRQARVSELLPALARRLGLEPGWQAGELEGAGIDLARRVDIELAEVERAELLVACGRACGVSLSERDGRLLVRAITPAE